MKIECDKACDERHVSASEHRKELLKKKSIMLQKKKK